jgi:hypothetical protein
MLAEKRGVGQVRELWYDPTIREYAARSDFTASRR